MIETIKASVDLTCFIVNYSLYLSYKIGHLLVNAISLFQRIVLKLTYILFDVYCAVFESISTFYQDIIQNFQHVLRTISSVDIITYLSDFRNILQSLVFVVVTLNDFVFQAIGSVVTAVQTVLLSPKYLVVYLKKTTWSIISGIKETFYDMGTLFYSFSQKAKDFLIASVLFWINLPWTMYNFFIEIPIESILGIAISCCLIYLFARFYIIVFSFSYQQFKRLFCYVRRKYNEFVRYLVRSSQPHRVVYRRQMLPTRRPRIRTERNTVNSPKSDENDRYCVICQEHSKCILLLPCRHLCMCNECVNTLQLYNNTCPICRSDIETTMQIFV